MNKSLNSLWGKINTKEEAVKVIKDISNGVYALSAITFLASFILGLSLIIDAILMGLLAFLLRKYKSRVFGVILFFYSLVVLSVTAFNRLGGEFGGGSNLILALIFVWFGIRALQATFKLHELISTTPPK